jgi:tetratricopeptide (TPR) repeat protein
LIELQHRSLDTEQVKRAANYFKRALQMDPHYPPALLNLAIVLQRYLNEPREALEKYGEYLALQPAPPQAKEVEKVAHQLDLDLRISIIPRKADHPVPSPAAPTNQTFPRPTPVLAENPVPKPAPPPVTKATPAEKPVASKQLPAPPQSPVQPPATPVAPTNLNTNVAGTESPAVNPPEEKGSSLIQKLNPINWFGKSKKTNDTETTTTAEAGNIDRYTYPLPVTPIPGDRKLAERLTSEGQQAQHQSNRAEAMRDYQEAIKADPTYFEAGLALGLAAIDGKDYPTALDALGQALTVDANSADARYAYAWVLGKRGYYQDAANELDRLLSVHPREVRAHLLLGNFDADNLARPKQARDHYLKALELIDPQSPQATDIRAWLDQHP